MVNKPVEGVVKRKYFGEVVVKLPVNKKYDIHRWDKVELKVVKKHVPKKEKACVECGRRCHGKNSYCVLCYWKGVREGTIKRTYTKKGDKKDA